MKTYVVLYRDEDAMYGSLPLGFMCQADDISHAQEQCDNAYPNSQIVWTVEGDNVQHAIDEYTDVVTLMGDSF